MSQVKSNFVKQAAFLTGANLFVRLLGFLYRPFLTEFIGDEGNALYSVGYSFYVLLLVISSAGLPSAISKMVSERMARGQYYNAHQIFKSALRVSIVSGLTCSLILWFLAEAMAYFWNQPGSALAIQALAPTVTIVAIMSVFRGYFQGMYNSVPTALSQIVEGIFNAFFTVWMAFIFREQLEYAAAGGAAGTGIGATAGLLVATIIYMVMWPQINGRIKEDNTKRRENPVHLTRELLLTALPIIMGSAVFSITALIDIRMITDRLYVTELFDENQIGALLGQFTGKFIVLTTLPVAISSALSQALVPSIAGNRVAEDKQAIRETINRALRISMLISIPAAMGMGVMAEPILSLLFPNHPEGAQLLQVGSVSIIFMALAAVATGMLQGLGKVTIPCIAAFVGMVAKVPLNYHLISNPEINIIGVVISTIVCYIIVASINVGYLKWHARVVIDWLGVFVKPLIASLVMGLACYVSYNAFMELSLHHNAVSTMASIGVGVLVYFMALLLLGGVYKDDIGQFGVK